MFLKLSLLLPSFSAWQHPEFHQVLLKMGRLICKLQVFPFTHPLPDIINYGVSWNYTDTVSLLFPDSLPFWSVWLDFYSCDLLSGNLMRFIITANLLGLPAVTVPVSSHLSPLSRVVSWPMAIQGMVLFITISEGSKGEIVSHGSAFGLSV